MEREELQAGQADRAYWVAMLDAIARPVMVALANRSLKATMPVERVAGKQGNDRHLYTHLEALGRTLSGLAPWLECPGLDGEEEELQQTYRQWARSAIDAATDPASPDYVNFAEGGQPIVDAAFLSHALLRAPSELLGKLDERVKANVALALKATRTRKPAYCNWLLFSAIIETALYRMGEQWDRMRVDYAIKEHLSWYKGDGVYGDGPEFHWDYYNSYVIQPMLLDIVAHVGEQEEDWSKLYPQLLEIAQRYAVVQERLIGSDGTFPPIGRSLAYRGGAFQHLAQMALQQQLPVELLPAQVRCALTAMIKRTMEAPGTFDEQGWLRIGLHGSQPGLGEGYISTGSLYLCTTAFLPLGLPPANEFWSGSSRAWTSKRIWSGQDTACDHALHL